MQGKLLDNKYHSRCWEQADVGYDDAKPMVTQVRG